MQTGCKVTDGGGTWISAILFTLDGSKSRGWDHGGGMQLRRVGVVAVGAVRARAKFHRTKTLLHKKNFFHDTNT
jgi:hypothetical protein